MKNKSIFFVILLSLLVMSLAACGTQPAGPASTGGAGLSATQTPTPASFNPDGNVSGSVPIEDATPTSGTPAAGEPTVGGTRTVVTSHGGPVQDYVSLIDNLRASGVTIEPSREVSQPFFSVKGYLIKVGGEDVQVFEYADEASAKADAVQVASDGGSIGTSIVNWVGTPHFYMTGKIIVLYVGDNASVTQALEKALGQQFAGR